MSLLKTINHIELSALCNNECQYCPSPKMREHRAVGLMSMETFKQTISWVTFFCGEETQTELNLHGIGEPLLNPECVEMVSYARQHLPSRIPIHMNTNGNLMDDKTAKALKDAGITNIDITGHDALVTAQTIRILSDAGIQGNVSFDFVLNPNNWAGQVDWLEPKYDAGPCPWVGQGQCMVSWDGNIHNCCIDAFGHSVKATVNDDISKYDVEHFELCDKCHHEHVLAVAA